MININKLVSNSIVITTGPVVKSETHIKFVDGTEGDYLIEGAMDCPALIAAGLMPPGSGIEEEDPSWIKQPLEATIGSAVTSIGSAAFAGCEGLTSVTIGNGVTNIGERAFAGCSGLTSVTIPDSVTSIGDWAFEDCSGLTSLTIGNGVTSIGERAFAWCSGLTSVTIPNGVTSIEYNAFAWCSGLTSVTIPDSVTSIGDWAFEDCRSLTSMTFSGKTKSTVQGMANYSWGLKSGCVLHCTDGDITL